MSLRERLGAPSLGLGEPSCNAQKVLDKSQIVDERLQDFRGPVVFDIYDLQSRLTKTEIG